MFSGIEILNINKSYGDNIVLKDFSARFAYNEVSSIMGVSGKGKTTLLKIILGLIPYDSGEIKGLEDKKIVAVFQENRLINNLSSLANILITCNIDKPSAENALKEIGLSEFINAPASSLSGGMKRRVAILRAILSDSDILVFDEPLKGLDEETKRNVIKIIKKYLKGKTLIFVTHDKEDLSFLESTNNIILN